MYVLVSPLNVESYWTVLAPWIAKAIGNEDPAGDLAIIRHKCCNNIAQIWIGKTVKEDQIDLVFVTEGMVLDDIPTLVIRWLTAADLDAVFLDFGLIERWALHSGYRRIQVWGRRGWERRLKPLGFTHGFTVMNKFIEQGLH